MVAASSEMNCTLTAGFRFYNFCYWIKSRETHLSVFVTKIWLFMCLNSGFILGLNIDLLLGSHWLKVVLLQVGEIRLNFSTLTFSQVSFPKMSFAITNKRHWPLKFRMSSGNFKHSVRITVKVEALVEINFSAKTIYD